MGVIFLHYYSTGTRFYSGGHILQNRKSLLEKVEFEVFNVVVEKGGR